MTLKDLASIVKWNEELILDALFHDIANEHTLLLFELFNDQPILKLSSKESASGSNYSNSLTCIAWGFLFPVSQSGELNCSIPDDWKVRNPNTATRSASMKGGNKVDRISDSSEDRTPMNGWRRRLSLRKDENDDKGNASDASKNSIEEGMRKENGSPNSKVEYEDIYDQNDSVIPFEKPQRRRSSRKSISTNMNIAIDDEPLVRDTLVRDNWIRIQLHRVVNYDGIIGFVQRKIKGWPSLLRQPSKEKSFRQSIDIENDRTFDYAYPDNIPPVYLQWRKRRRYPLTDLWISVSLKPCPIAMAVGFKHHRQIPDDSRNSFVGGNIDDGGNTTAEDANKTRAALLKRLRAPSEPCAIPDRVLHRLDVRIIIECNRSSHSKNGPHFCLFRLVLMEL